MTHPVTVDSGDFKSGPVTIEVGNTESAGSVIATLVGGDAASAPPASAASPSPLSAAPAKGNAKAIDDGKGESRSLSLSLFLGRDESITKMLLDQEHERIIARTIVGSSAGDLIAEAALTKMKSDALNIGQSIRVRHCPTPSA